VRTLILQMQVSLDGFVADANGKNDFIFPSFTPASTAWMVERLDEAGAHLMGRKTYVHMAHFWPTATMPQARSMNELPKVVFSKTLREAAWGPVTIASGDLKTEVAQLKGQVGKPLLAHGGAGFARSLIATGEVDELRFIEHPVALGDGLRAFPPGPHGYARRDLLPFEKLFVKVYTRV
jgi:dihydrofolate reductase